MSITKATLDSIRRLAERPGTEHEGIVAREMLAKFEARLPSEQEEERLVTAYTRFMRREISLVEFLSAMSTPMMTREEEMAVNEIQCKACRQWIQKGEPCEFCIEREKRRRGLESIKRY